MKKSLERDRLEKEEIQLRALIMSLIDDNAGIATHKSTGIVYNKNVLNNNLQEIMNKHTRLTKELEE